MPSSVTDFLHHVHAEKTKTPTKNKYPTKQGIEAGDENGSEDDEEEDGDDIGDRDNEHELYLLHQHQQQLSEKLTAQLLRQQQEQMHRNRLSPADRRTSDPSLEAIHRMNPWERRNKRTYQDENLLVDYIIDMPVGENSENWNLVTNDDLGELHGGYAGLVRSRHKIVRVEEEEDIKP